MKIAIINFGDVHMHGVETNNIISTRMEPISRIISEYIKTVDQFIILNVGDIAQSGQVEEYEMFAKWQDSLLERVRGVTGKTPLVHIAVPGNHDCDIPIDAANFRKLIINEIVNNGGIDKYTVEQCISCQNNFFQFIYSDTHNFPNTDQKIYNRVNFDVEGHTIAFHLYNSSWLCERYDSQGNLVIPRNIMHNNFEPSDISIAVMHHPFNWLDASNYRDVMDHMATLSDIVITGHEHASSHTGIEIKAGRVNQMANGALQQFNSDIASEFQIFLCDFDDLSFERINCTVDDAIKVHKDEKVFFEHVSMRRKLYLNPSSQFIRELSRDNFDGILVSGELSSIFKPSPLRSAVESEEDTVITYIDLLNTVETEDKIAIYGPSLSGKSFLLKKLATELIKNGNFVVYAENGSITTQKKNALTNYISKYIEEHYSVEEDIIWGLDKSKRIIIVDDFHLMTLGKQKASEFIKLAESLFGKVIVAMNLDFIESTIIMKKYGSNLFHDYNKYKISTLRNLDRLHMIESWWKAKNENGLIPPHSMARTKDIIDNILASNPFPSYPIFILSLLQKVDSSGEIEHNSNTSQIYDSLIDVQISKISSKIINYPALISILAAIAGELTRKGANSLNITELTVVLENYEQRILESIKKEKIIDALVENNILEVKNGQYSFSFKYTFYFSIAKHLEDVMQSEEYHSEIKKLIGEIYEERNANILLFTLYTSRNQSLIKELIAKADSLLIEYEEKLDFSKFPSALELKAELELIYRESDPTENQRQLSEDKDRMDHKLKNRDDTQASSEPQTTEKDAETRKLASEIMSVKPIISVIGQVLKSESGRLDGSLKKLALESIYKLILRWSNFFLSNIGEITESAVQEIKKREEDKQDLDQVVHLLSAIYTALVAGSIKDFTGTSSTNRLSMVYDKIHQSSNSLEMEIVNFSSCLDANKGIPRLQLNNLIDKSKSGNFMYMNIIRILVLFKIYYGEVDLKTKMEVLSQLNIRFDAKAMRQRIIEN